MGYAFTFPLAKWAGLPVAAYIHYPTISTDMLQRVELRQSGHTNSASTSTSWLQSEAKLMCAPAPRNTFCLVEESAHASLQILPSLSRCLRMVFAPCRRPHDQFNLDAQPHQDHSRFPLQGPERKSVTNYLTDCRSFCWNRLYTRSIRPATFAPSPPYPSVPDHLSSSA